MSNFSRYLPFFIITLLGYGVIFYQKDTLLSQEPDVAPKKQIVQISSLKQANKANSENIITKSTVFLQSVELEEDKAVIREIPSIDTTDKIAKKEIKKVEVIPIEQKEKVITPTKINEISEISEISEIEKLEAIEFTQTTGANAEDTTKKPNISEKNELVQITVTKSESIKEEVPEPFDFTQTKAIDVASLKGTELDEILYLHLDLPRRPLRKNKKHSKATKTQNKNNQKVASQKIASKNITLKKVTPKKVESNSITAQVLNQPEKQKRVFKRIDKNTTPQLSKQDNPNNLQEAIAITGNKPDYPEQARVLNQKGLVVIQFIVTTRGETRNPSIMVSSGYSELDRAVIAFVVKERFMPALKDNEKITAEQIYSFAF